MTRFLLLSLAAATSSLFGAAQNSRLSMQATGQFDSSNTVVYSVFAATREEALGDLQLSVAMPANTRFLEHVDAPAGARYDGVADNIITWTIPALAADTLTGPFNFRIRIDPAKADQTPIAPPAWISYAKPAQELLEDPGNPAQLKPLAESGTLTVDTKGTGNLVSVGDTGILLYVPEGAIASGTVTFRFKRLTVDDSKMPQNATDTWWCALYEMSTTPVNVEFAKPIVYSLPSRRAVPIGLGVRAFSSADGQEWQERGGSAMDAKLPSIGFGGSGGGFGGSGCTVMPFGFPTCRCTGFQCGFNGGFGGFGVSQTQRSVGAISGATLSQQFGTSIKPAQITDGTSNTIIAILIGIR